MCSGMTGKKQMFISRNKNKRKESKIPTRGLLLFFYKVLEAKRHLSFAYFGVQDNK